MHFFFDETLQKVGFIHGAAPWLRNLEHNTTLDMNLRISAFRKSSGSDNNRITVELANDQASVVMFISTCGDVFKKSLSQDQVAEFNSLAVLNATDGGPCFPMFHFDSDHRFRMGNFDLKQKTSIVSIVVFAGANVCCSESRLVDECFITCKHAIAYILAQLKFQDAVGGFHALQTFCGSFAHDECVEHRVSPSATEKPFVFLKSTVQLPLSASFYTRAPVNFNEIASIWMSTKIICRTHKLESKISFDSMPHPASLDVLIKSLSEHASGFSGKKKASGMILNVLAETSNKQQFVHRQDFQPSSHTMIRRKSIGNVTAGLLSADGSATSTSPRDQRKTITRGRGKGSISGMAGVDLTEIRQSSGKTSQKQIITTQAKTSTELRKGLISKNAPKPRILKELQCTLDEFGQDSVFDHHEITSAFMSCSQKILAFTMGTCLNFVEIAIGKHLHTKLILRKEMSANLLIVQICEYADTTFLVLSNGRLVCLKEASEDSEKYYTFAEFETYIDNCNFCTVLIHRDWLNICGSEGSQIMDYVRFKLESGNVVESSGHGLPLGLSTSISALQFHVFDSKFLSPFVLCGLCNSDIEVWGKMADEDLYLMQCLRNRTSGLGAINSICSMGKDTIAVGHDGGYVHFWSIEISSKSVSSLDRQFSISPSSDGLPRSFQTISADKFSEDTHQLESQLFVLNEHCGDSALVHAETGVLLHTFSSPLFSPHILHRLSGQSSQFVTVFELSVLWMQGFCLHHAVFQLLYLSSDQTSISKNLACVPLGQARVSHVQVHGDTLESQRRKSMDQFGVQSDARRGRSIHTSASMRCAFDGPDEPMARGDSSASVSIHISEPDDCDTQDDYDFSNCPFHERMPTSKASGIMSQILARRSSTGEFQGTASPSLRSGSTEHLESINAEDGEDGALAWQILRPLFPSPTKIDIQQESCETVRMSEHSDTPHQHTRTRVPQTLPKTKLHGGVRLNTSSQSSHLQKTSATVGSTLPKKLHSSQFNSPSHVHTWQIPNVENRHEHVDKTSSEHRKLLSAFNAKYIEEPTTSAESELQHRRPNPLIHQSVFSPTSKYFQPSSGASSSMHTGHENDSFSVVMQLRPHPLLAADDRMSCSGLKEHHDVHKNSRSTRLPKSLQ